MTGIAVDLLTAILITILAFICGHSAGHRVGREETRSAMITLVKAASGNSGKESELSKLFNKGDTK